MGTLTPQQKKVGAWIFGVAALAAGAAWVLRKWKESKANVPAMGKLTTSEVNQMDNCRLLSTLSNQCTVVLGRLMRINGMYKTMFGATNSVMDSLITALQPIGSQVLPNCVDSIFVCGTGMDNSCSSLGTIQALLSNRSVLIQFVNSLMPIDLFLEQAEPFMAIPVQVAAKLNSIGKWNGDVQANVKTAVDQALAFVLLNTPPTTQLNAIRIRFTEGGGCVYAYGGTPGSILVSDINKCGVASRNSMADDVWLPLPDGSLLNVSSGLCMNSKCNSDAVSLQPCNVAGAGGWKFMNRVMRQPTLENTTCQGLTPKGLNLPYRQNGRQVRLWGLDDNGSGAWTQQPVNITVGQLPMPLSIIYLNMIWSALASVNAKLDGLSLNQASVASYIGQPMPGTYSIIPSNISTSPTEAVVQVSSLLANPQSFAASFVGGIGSTGIGVLNAAMNPTNLVNITQQVATSLGSVGDAVQSVGQSVGGFFQDAGGTIRGWFS